MALHSTIGPRLIVLTGLPGAGKSVIAEAMALELNAPVYAKDWLEAPILRTGLVPRERLGAIGYDLLTALARRPIDVRPNGDPRQCRRHRIDQIHLASSR